MVHCRKEEERRGEERVAVGERGEH